jgi:hypothetical protein
MQKIVQFTKLGKYGRFGNQLFQYAFARAYAEKYDAILEIPKWIGEKIFKNVVHQRPSCVLPRVEEKKIPWGQVNIDLFGYFQKKRFVDIMSESKVRDWLQFKNEWVEKFKQEKEYSIVAHLRRGDYLEKYSNHFCVITKESYIEACKTHNLSKNKLVWLTEETQKFNPELDADLQFLPDFFSMINADVLLRANSTFSLWAGFFNRNKVYSPLVEDKVGFCDVDFVEGKSSKIVPRGSFFVLNR